MNRNDFDQRRKERESEFNQELEALDHTTSNLEIYRNMSPRQKKALLLDKTTVVKGLNGLVRSAVQIRDQIYQS